MPFTFRTINAVGDRDYFVPFRRDASRISFGHAATFDEQEYRDLIEARTREFPDGYVMVELDGRVVGQIEMHPREFEGRTIGFVSLLYLIPELRAKGYGMTLIQYVEDVFRRHGVPEYHLRVSPTNKPAVRFYKKCGLVKIREERHQHAMWRLGKLIESGRMPHP